MNCLDKMYKEIEEIIKKEEQERAFEARPYKEIKRGFSSSFDSVDVVTNEVSLRNYLSEISLEGANWQKKYFDAPKAGKFIKFIFNKYLCFYGDGVDKSLIADFISGIDGKLTKSENLLDVLTTLENEFISISGVDKGEETEKYFLNPYNALFSDEKGYYAVIDGNKFSDVKRPIGFNFNQMKKVVKETFDEYAENFKSKFSTEKEFIAFMNSLKAEVNKADFSDPLAVESMCEEKLLAFLEKKGVTKPTFVAYVEQKGLRLVKQGNFYFHKKAYESYAEYKKIEFRY